ncbi:hypothetical protein AB1K84_25260 [Mesobacillus foraminis]|uniref:hypothetical protein n=1 Tax=Mesobacillus foraminis TaxID=279826 RepID=UPI0039A311A7
MDIAKLNDLIETAKTHVGEDWAVFLEFVLDYAPYLGPVIQRNKLNRANQRIEKHSDKLRYIQQLSSETRLSAEFIQEKIAPIVFTDFIEEHEDAKINYILTGFQNVFLEEKTNESIIYGYFDTLRALRYGDLRRLFYHAGLDVMYPSKEALQENEIITYTYGLDIKLRNQNLINIPVTMGGLEGEEHFDEDRKYHLSSYGFEFVKFIASKKFIGTEI